MTFRIVVGILTGLTALTAQTPPSIDRTGNPIDVVGLVDWSGFANDVYGDVVIHPGAELRINFGELNMKCAHDDQFRIQVLAGGRLSAYQSTLGGNPSNGAATNFAVYGDASNGAGVMNPDEVSMRYHTGIFCYGSAMFWSRALSKLQNAGEIVVVSDASNPNTGIVRLRDSSYEIYAAVSGNVGGSHNVTLPVTLQTMTTLSASSGHLPGATYTIILENATVPSWGLRITDIASATSTAAPTAFTFLGCQKTRIAFVATDLVGSTHLPCSVYGQSWPDSYRQFVPMDSVWTVGKLTGIAGDTQIGWEFYTLYLSGSSDFTVLGETLVAEAITWDTSVLRFDGLSNHACRLAGTSFYTHNQSSMQMKRCRIGNYSPSWAASTATLWAKDSSQMSLDSVLFHRVNLYGLYGSLYATAWSDFTPTPADWGHYVAGNVSL
jgi:hypothetical protein